MKFTLKRTACQYRDTIKRGELPTGKSERERWFFCTMVLMDLAQRLEAILFYIGEPISRVDLVNLTEATPEDTGVALLALQSALTARGLRLIITDTDVSLVTAPECAELIERMRKEELKRDIGKAGAETLSIILYRGPLSRTDIDYIRGVNSSFILRNLLVRGLIVRTANPKDQRTYVYGVSTDLLAQLGVTKKEDLPDYEHIMTAIDTFEKNRETELSAAPSSLS